MRYNYYKNEKMKKTLLMLLISVSFYSNAQGSEFTFNSKNGMTDYLVSECKGKTQSELYITTNEWIVKSFKNSNEVIQGQTEKEFIRIEGFTKNFNGAHDATYVVEISFKDGKYKFDPKSFIMTYGTNVFNLFETYPSYFKSDGSTKDRVKVTIDGATNLMNDLNKELKSFISDNEVIKDTW